MSQVIELTTHVFYVQEVVIHADPANVPLSLFFLAKLLRESYGPGSVNMKKYWHSSCQDRTDVQVCYASIVNLPEEESSAGTGNTIDICIIWKKGLSLPSMTI